MSSFGESSADVQREAEADRADLVRTLDQLRENLKPANVVDEVMASAKVSTSDISDRVWQTARSNPIPAAFIALGAAMLTGWGRKTASTPQSSDNPPTKRPRTTAFHPDPARATAPRGFEQTRAERTTATGQFAARLDDAEARAARSTSQIECSVRSIRREAYRSNADRLPSARKGSDRPSGVKTMSYSFRSRGDLSNSLARLIEEQPLVLAAVGVAIGAAIGAAIPNTETESRLMGDASVSLRSRAQDIAQSEMAHLKATASSTLDQLKQTAADHGLSSDNLSGLVQDTGATVRNAVQEATDHAASTAGLKS